MGKGPFVNGQEIPELGNYMECTFRDEDEGITYHSTEQYFQSKKCKDRLEFEKMMTLSPIECARFGRRVIKLVDNWESIKVKVMERGNLLKFEQISQLRDSLTSTYPHRLYFCENKKQDQWDVFNETILTELRRSFFLQTIDFKKYNVPAITKDDES